MFLSGDVTESMEQAAAATNGEHRRCAGKCVLQSDESEIREVHLPIAGPRVVQCQRAQESTFLW